MENRTRPASSTSCVIFLSKAEDFADAMRLALQHENWNSAAILAVHCTISSCDAVTSFYLGKRSASQNHADVLKLIGEIRPLPNVKEKKAQIAEVLGIKSKAEYSDELIPEKTARDAVKRTERIFAWAKGIVFH